MEVADSHSSMQGATLDSDRQSVYRWVAALWSFRLHSCFLMSLAVSACVMWPSLPYYAPTNIPIWMNQCTMRGGYIARVFERDGVAVDLLSDPAVAPFRGTLRITIPAGQTATFLDAHIETSAYGSTRQTIEFWSPWCQKPDRISGPRRVECDFATSISDLKGLVVAMPPIEINGSRYDVRPVAFSLQAILRSCSLLVVRASDIRGDAAAVF